MTISSVRVPVIKDDTAEESERFDLLLIVPPSLALSIAAGGRNTSIGSIIDSTSKHSVKCVERLILLQEFIAYIYMKVTFVRYSEITPST